jgi:hypothetical protein
MTIKRDEIRQALLDVLDVLFTGVSTAAQM